MGHDGAGVLKAGAVAASTLCGTLISIRKVHISRAPYTHFILYKISQLSESV